MKIVPQLDTYPRLVSFGQMALGKAVLLVAFAVGLLVNHVDSWIEMTVAMALISYFPARRRVIVSIAALNWLLFHSTWLNWPFLGSLAKAEGLATDWRLTALVSGIFAAVFCGFTFFFHFVRGGRAPSVSFAAKRPVLCLVAGYAAVLATAGLLPLSGMTRLVA
jgi:hypothetical protein